MTSCTTETVLLVGEPYPLDGFGTDSQRRGWNCGEFHPNDVAFYVMTFAMILMCAALLLSWVASETWVSLRAARMRTRTNKAGPESLADMGPALELCSGHCSAPPG